MRAIGRVAAVGAVIGAIVLVALILFGGAAGGGYKVKAQFLNAGQLVKGNPVQVSGVPVGSVKGIRITDDGHAEVELSIDGDHAPLRHPTFLDERKATMARLEDFSRSTHPLVNDLKGPADDLGPTVRDLGDLAPDLERLFGDLGPLIRESRTGVPALERTLREAEPLTEALHTFFPELNPILSYLNFHQQTIAGFMTNGGADLNADYGTGQRGQTQMGIVSESRAFQGYPWGEPPPDWVRGNAYLQPNGYARALLLGGVESFKCPGGERKYADDAVKVGQDHDDKRAPCFEVPPSLYDGRFFPYPRKGRAPLRQPPRGLAGSPPATDPDPND